MRILHLSQTPCAGAIHALSTAIADYSLAESRWCGRSGEAAGIQFAEPDFTWFDTEVFPALAEADVLVLHNYLGLDTQPLLDFAEARRKDLRVVGMFHSHPSHCNLDLLERGFLCFAVAQFQACLLPACRPVRNVIRWDRADWPTAAPRDPERGAALRLGFSFTTRAAQAGSMHEAGWWDTKGYEVTLPVLEALEGEGLIELVRIEGVRHDMALRLKAECDVLLDEVVTGSYHRTTLEGLALGKPTLCSLTPEVFALATKAAGADFFPAVIARLERSPEWPEHFGLEEALRWLAARGPDGCAELGRHGRDWMIRYWHPRDIAREFVEVCASTPTVDEILGLKEVRHGSSE